MAASVSITPSLPPRSLTGLLSLYRPSHTAPAPQRATYCCQAEVTEIARDGCAPVLQCESCGETVSEWRVVVGETVVGWGGLDEGGLLPGYFEIERAARELFGRREADED